MTIYFAANLLAGYESGTNMNASDTNASAGYDELTSSNALFAPNGIQPSATSGNIDVKLESALTDFWVSIMFYRATTALLTASVVELGVFGGNKSLALRWNNNLPTLEWWNGTVWTVLTSSTRLNKVLYSGAKHKFDIQVKVHATAGFIKVYHWGKLILSYSGNTSLNSVSSVDWVRLCGTTSSDRFSETIVASRKTIGLRVYTASVNAAGATNTFTTGLFTAIDEETGSAATVDTDFAQSDAIDQILLVDVDVLGTTTMPVRAVVVNSRVLYTGAAPQKINQLVRMAATDYHGSDKIIGTTFGGIFTVWESNPNTAVAWTTAEISTLQVGVRSRT